MKKLHLIHLTSYKTLCNIIFPSYDKKGIGNERYLGDIQVCAIEKYWEEYDPDDRCPDCWAGYQLELLAKVKL